MHDQKTRERTVLVLQGGGALGSYQGGVYEALSKNDYVPDWIAGISIGAVNAALIAGNPPELRAKRLGDFWDLVSSRIPAPYLTPTQPSRNLYNKASAALTTVLGAPGFFEPRFPPAFPHFTGGPGALSVYKTDQLRETLEKYVDFERLNSGATRISVGAVNIETGNFTYFDSARQSLTPEHIMASGALPPGFAPVEIDGAYYWDGGLVSNTPLQYVLDERPRPDMLIFQVDLFSARGPMPDNLSQVAERQKDIRYSSRTRLNTDIFRTEQSIRRATHRLLHKLPDTLKDDPDVALLHEFSCDAAVTIVHLIHQRRQYYAQSKDYEFSRLSIEEHWQDGVRDVEATLLHDDWKKRKKPQRGVNVYDLARDS
ncbi:DUF3734 domain-containing protein [Varunaivibrio sulfuroxidans]|uniref:NTE family protein n=1 Tax=Varunaivibrio sulfuroxidans TaxID=1773489 RepID=A0A4R3JGC7_9PROT|nr:patatin-like phospholipase family protein [Varunaivibrio sulfuroxidans]TCS64353.1 NTE family protein [Varunaivibrio sulfuroxidans]WES31211.1 patatin-like phospholipase family protein [Varunaivibrio sulfuroxidans]